MTNILTLPVAEVDFLVGTNEDWLDGLGFTDNATPPNPIVITGIAFELQMRARASDRTALLIASTANSRILVGPTTLALNVPVTLMKLIPPSPDAAPYVIDIVASAEGHTRRVVTGKVVVVQGVTRQ
jgi:hypothetical protein